MKSISQSVVTIICLALVAMAFVYAIGQASQGAYQEGLRAGKASAQATAYDEGYSQGYEKGYASAVYEVNA